MGEAVGFSFEFISDKKQAIVVDYGISFQKANGSLSDKVFKLKELDLKKHENIKLEKLFSFKTITTRKYYPGAHKVFIQINGKKIAEDDFELL